MRNRDRQIILIGGSPTSGKSTTARLISHELHLPWISTDQIRDTMRVSANKKDWPELFNASDYIGERFLTELSAEEIVRMEIAQGEEVWQGIKTFIEEDYTWHDGFIIEGVNLLPHLIVKDFKDCSNIKSIFLVDENIERVRDIVYNRGVWADADTYSDSVKEKEVDWVLLYSKRIKEEAKKYGFPVIEVTKDESSLQSVLTALNM